MSEGQSFLGRESGRPVEGSDVVKATPLCLGTSLTERRGPLPVAAGKAWAIAFKINVAVTVISAVWTLAARSPAEYERQEVLLDAGYYSSLFVVLTVLTWALSWCMLCAMFYCPRQILQIAFVVFVVASGTVVVWMLSSDTALWAIFTLVVSAVVANVIFRRGRVSLAAANLKVAASAVRCIPNVFLWSLSVAIIRFVWLVVAGIAWTGSIAALHSVQGPDGTTYSANECETLWRINTGLEYCKCNGIVISEDAGCNYSHRGLGTFLACFWMASMGWGFVGFTNIMTATVARSVSLWWSTPKDPEPVWRSCQHVMKNSLGPSCKSAAIDGLGCRLALFPLGDNSPSSFVWMVAPYWLPKGNFVNVTQPLGFVFSLSLFLVKLVASYVLGYTAVFIGMHSLSFSEAAGRTKALLRQVGMTVLVNEMVVGVGLLGAGVAPVLMYLYVALHQSNDSWAVPFYSVLVACTHSAFFVFLLPMIEVVLCAYKAVLVCFAQDPEALAAHHDHHLHDRLYKAWRNMQLTPPSERESNPGV